MIEVVDGSGQTPAADWRELVPAEDRQVYETAGFGARVQGLGERPALLVIDVTHGFVGSKGLDRAAAAAEFRNACGPAAWEAIPFIQGLLAMVRSAGLPVFYTKGRAQVDVGSLGQWSANNSRAAEDLAKGAAVHEIIPEVAPAPGELVIEKDKPSAFFGTSLLSHLIRLGIDSLLVAGCTTSGCVRATVVDAFSYNLAVTVVEDAVFDRGELPHAVNLFDMQAKYAQVVRLDAARAMLDR